VTGSTFFAMSSAAQIAALAITFVVHVAGALCLIWALLGDRGFGGLRDWWNDGGDGPPPPEPRDPEPPRPSGTGLALPLSDALQSDVRLREPGRIADGYPKPGRRREHEPERRPERAPSSR
jgi:hypothetical protein